MASQISKYGLNRLSSIHRDFPLDSPFQSKFSLPKTSHSPISLTWIIFSHLTIYAINGCSRIQRQQLLKLKYDIIDVFKNFSFLHPEKELWFYCMGLNLSSANMPSKKIEWYFGLTPFTLKSSNYIVFIQWIIVILSELDSSFLIKLIQLLFHYLGIGLTQILSKFKII